MSLPPYLRDVQNLDASRHIFSMSKKCTIAVENHAGAELMASGGAQPEVAWMFPIRLRVK
jgi:hypothetical protein